MNIQFFRRLMLLAIILLAAACQKSAELTRLDETTFIQVYCDVVGYADIIEPQNRQALRDSVFEHHGITQPQFDFTVKHYSDDPQSWQEIFEKILIELEKRSEAADSIRTKMIAF
ncbi:MAG TPA: DUF4296 domain-containing protein [bacterium]|nr:DUF4296 domain-containing protein [bacterium]